MRGAGHRGDVAVAQAGGSANDGLLLVGVGHPEARAEVLEIGIGQRARSFAARTGTGVNQSALNAPGQRVRLVRVEVAPAIVFASRRKHGLPTHAKVDHQIRFDPPVRLEEAGIGGPLLADVADSFRHAVGGVAKQHRRDGTAARRGEVGVALAAAGVFEVERHAAGDALAAKAVVILIHRLSAELDRVFASDDRHIVGKLLDEVLRPVVGASAPLAVAVGEVHIDQVLSAVGDIDGAEFGFPIDAAQHGGLRRIVILFPVVAAAVEVVEDRRRDVPIPAGAENIRGPAGIVVIHEQAGQIGGALRARLFKGAVVAPVARDAVFVVEDVVALQTELGVGPNDAAAGDQEIVLHITDRSRGRTVVRCRRHAAAENTEGLHNFRVEEALRNQIVRKRCPGDQPRRVGGLRGGVVNRDPGAGVIHPVAEVAVVHFRRWYGALRTRGAFAVAEGFVAGKEEGLVLAVVEFRNVDGSAHRTAEIVLLVNGPRDTAGVVEKVVRVQHVIAQELIGRAV